jgi:hypothetical protein
VIVSVAPDAASEKRSKGRMNMDIVPSAKRLTECA